MLLSPVAWHHYVFMLALPLVVLVADAWATWPPGAARGALLAGRSVLSMPDDAWRAAVVGDAGQACPARLAGQCCLLLWAGLLRVGTTRSARHASGMPTSGLPHSSTSTHPAGAELARGTAVSPRVARSDILNGPLETNPGAHSLDRAASGARVGTGGAVLPPGRRAAVAQHHGAPGFTAICR